jgi:DNA polymerase V
MSIFALVDCNNFYASCERVFNPRLEGKPIVILSNNDGCVIARSNEAKKIGIPMGAPYYQWRQVCEQHQVHVFSSNYELYGDMSQRVMSSLERLCPDIEIYSIDEAFLIFDGFSSQELYAYAVQIRKTIKQWTGIPVSVGLSLTKTLAKCANKLAKGHATDGVWDLTKRESQDKALTSFPIEDIWGIGRRLSVKLHDIGIHTAADLRDEDRSLLRNKFGIVMEKISHELNGTSCLPIETIQPKKQIISSRSFGKLVTELSELEEAVSHYTALACIKLRKQKSVASGICVFLHTNRFRESDSQYSNSLSYFFPDATDDTGYMISMVKQSLKKIYRKHFRYHKAGIMLLDIKPNHIQQLSLLSTIDTKKQSLMTTIDAINKTIGKNSLFFCAEGIEKRWQIKREYRSPRYTTHWDELVVINS